MSPPPTALVFGATGHIGGPAARALLDGGHRVRVASSRPDGVRGLVARFPGAQAVLADMTSPESLAVALMGADSVFVVTPDFFDERAGAEALLEGAARIGARPHVVRVQAEVPGVGVDDLPGRLSQPVGRRGHLEARGLIAASGLPATFLNVLGYYLDDLLIHFAGPLRSERRLLVPHDRPMCWIDPAELGEAAAAVLAAPPPDHPRLLHLNNGEDGIRFSALAETIGELCGTPVTYADDPDAFRATVGPMLTELTGDPRAADYLLADWRFEREHGEVYRGTGELERLIGRRPMTVRGWLNAHRGELLAG